MKVADTANNLAYYSTAKITTHYNIATITVTHNTGTNLPYYNMATVGAHYNTTISILIK
jgi:hypothetical protein